MHDCNRLRDNGYKDKTWVDRVPENAIREFDEMRQIDEDRKQNVVNSRFPSLQEARDMYLKAEAMQGMTPEEQE